LVQIIKQVSLFQLTVRQYVIAVHILVAEFADVYYLASFPLVDRGLASFLFLPVPVDQMCSVAVGLFSDSNLVLEYTIVLAFGVLVVVDASNSVGMTT
jgi:hypothetical protein